MDEGTYGKDVGAAVERMLAADAEAIRVELEGAAVYRALQQSFHRH